MMMTDLKSEFSDEKSILTQPRNTLLRDLICGQNKSLEAWTIVNPLGLASEDLSMIKHFAASAYCTTLDMKKIIKMDADTIALAISPMYRAMRHNDLFHAGKLPPSVHMLAPSKDRGQSRIGELKKKAAEVIQELEKEFGPKSTWKSDRKNRINPDVNLFSKRSVNHGSKKPRF